MKMGLLSPTAPPIFPKSDEPDLARAKQELDAAIQLHKKHMNGTAPTTGPAGEKSQMKMMMQMRAAREALGDYYGRPE